MSQAEREATKDIDLKSEHPLILSPLSISKLLLISTKSVTLKVNVPKIRSSLEKKDILFLMHLEILRKGKMEDGGLKIPGGVKRGWLSFLLFFICAPLGSLCCLDFS